MTSRRLRLQRETLRHLSNAELRRVAGGTDDGDSGKALRTNAPTVSDGCTGVGCPHGEYTDTCGCGGGTEPPTGTSHPTTVAN